jgi:hypothetical protein
MFLMPATVTAILRAPNLFSKPVGPRLAAELGGTGSAATRCEPSIHGAHEIARELTAMSLGDVF